MGICGHKLNAQNNWALMLQYNKSWFDQLWNPVQVYKNGIINVNIKISFYIANFKNDIPENNLKTVRIGT